MRQWLLMLFLGCCLLLAGCGTTTHITGVVTDTHTWWSFIPCGKTICSQIHHSFVVNGREYQDDWDEVWIGDHVSFDYNSVWGVENFNGVDHHDGWMWWLAGGIVLVILVGISGVVWWRRKYG